MAGTAANVSDVSQAYALLHGHEEDAFGDAGYIGVDNKHAEMKSKCVKWRVVARRSKIKPMKEGPLKDLTVALERIKAQIRSRAEHPFHVVKNLFGHLKVRYKEDFRQEHGAAVQPVRVGEPGDCEKSAIADPWEQSVMCAKM